MSSRGHGLLPHLSILVFVIGALAGCVSEPESKGNDGVGTVDFDDPDAITIEGVVVDDELVPVAGVLVTLTPSDQSVETDETGAFRFAVLKAGTYTLDAYKEQYDPAIQEVRVGTESVTGIQLMVIRTPDGIPYHETESFVSYAFCHGPIGGGCFIVNTVLHGDYLPEDRPDFMYEVPNNGFKELRFEAQWDSPPTAGVGGFIARNPNGLFLGCNNTSNPDPYEPTIHYYENNNPEGEVDGSDNPNPSREPSPVQMWVRAGDTNPEVGGCTPMPQEKGSQIWQTVRISGQSPHVFALDTRVDVFLTFFYWQRSLDRDFTVLELDV